MICSLISLSAYCAAAPLSASGTGLVVEEIGAGGTAARTPLRVGDVLRRWQIRSDDATGATASEGLLNSPFDLHHIEIERSPLGAVELIVQRGAAEQVIDLPPGKPGLKVRPQLSERALALYHTMAEANLEGDVNLAEDLPRALAKQGSANEAWSWLYVGAQTGRDTLDQALRAAAPAGSDAVASVLLWRAARLDEQGAADAPDAWRAYIEHLLANDIAGLRLAHGRYMLGTLEGRRGDLKTGEALIEQALEIRRRLAPGSIELAEALIAVGISRGIQGDLDGADGYFEEALQVAVARDAASGTVAAAHIALGNVAQRRGELDAAGDYFAEGLRINRNIEPRGLHVGLALNNLGIVAEETGNLAAAEAYYDEALAIKRERSTGSIHVPRGIENLAYVALARGDLARAEDLQAEALGQYETLAPGSLVVSTSLKLLGRINHERGNLDGAREYWLRAQELEGAIAPNTLSYTEILDGLARIAQDHEEWFVAQDYATQALKIRQQVAPASLAVAGSLYQLGRLSAAQDDRDAALEQLERARQLYSRLAPGTAGEANALHATGKLHWQAGQPLVALQLFRAALDAIEAQRGKLGGTDPIRARFAARYGHLYKDTIDLLLELGRSSQAFDVLERYRARSLLAMLAGRQVDLSDALPAALAERRAALNRDYDAATAKLQALADVADNHVAIDSLLAELRALRNEREQLALAVRTAAPRLASIESARTLGIDAVFGLLAPGSTLLSYDIGEHRSHLFALAKSADGSIRFDVFPLTQGAASLRAQISALRLLQRLPNAPAASIQQLEQRAHALYKQLLHPAATMLVGSDRLIIVPDGPLHQLAFTALITEETHSRNTNDRPTYVIDQHAVHTVVSATLLGELSARKAATGGQRLVAFADPALPAQPLEIDGDTARAAADRAALPFARREAQAIAALYADSSRLLLGGAATEREAKSQSTQPRYLHFAAHGVLDQRSPLDSYLLLAPSRSEADADNGLLQAWEVFEQMRIDADLVTLSACDTGIGADGGGEGLLGLTRAFHYAGARAVLASLWPVSDRSTELLMTAFYNNLRDGIAADEALRQAQLGLLNGTADGGFRSWLRQRFGAATPQAHPFHWAAFQLAGNPGTVLLGN